METKPIGSILSFKLFLFFYLSFTHSLTITLLQQWRWNNKQTKNKTTTCIQSLFEGMDANGKLCEYKSKILLKRQKKENGCHLQRRIEFSLALFVDVQEVEEKSTKILATFITALSINGKCGEQQ